MEFTSIYLQAAAPASGGTTTLFFWGAVLLVFWLFMIRPQMRKQKEQRNFSSSISKGDEVVTNSGIVGKVNKIEGNFVVLETSKSFIKVLASSISKELTESLNPKPEQKRKGLFG